MSVVSVGDQHWIDRVGPIDGIDLVPWDLTGTPARADEIEYVVTPYTLNPGGFEGFARLPNLRGIQLLSAGFEHAVPFLPAGVELANGRDIHSSATAELAVTLALAAQRGLPACVDAQHQGRWIATELGFQPGVADKQVLVIGYGAIGHAITRRLLALEATVTAVASRARAGDDLVERIHGIDELDTLLPEADIVVLILPLRPQTERLVDAAFIEAMKPGALLVNVARGKIVDSDALVAACASGRIRAALDVTDPEPLPADHPLWTTPGVLITPHVGGPTDAFEPRATALIRHQLERIAAGQGLDYVVATG